MRYLLKTPEALVFLVSGWIALCCNAGFWHVIAANAPAGTLPGLLYFASFLTLTIGLISLVMLLLAFGRVTRLILGVALVVAASAGYFTYRYGVLFDPGMLTNIIETNSAEAYELLSVPIITTTLVAGMLPAVAIWAFPLARRRLSVAFLHRGIALVIAMGLIAVPLLESQKEIFSVARNHRELRHMIAPLNVISASYITIRERLETPAAHHSVALDASHATASGHKPLVHVLIVGETARAANFSLGGYSLDTNPELSRVDGIHFTEMHSCGTATAVSLPCMFSIQEHSEFDRDASRNEDNLLDVAARAIYTVSWIDNGNGCKDICEHVAHRDVHLSDAKDICPDGECFDEILVEELSAMLDSVTVDTFIVLHGLGSHGPAYYRRYPESYRLFKPDCRSPNFGDCSQQEISNAYDNTIAYTDHVIATAIAELSAHSDDFDASLVYVSDHGESLGEHGVYLHGMPYKLAPEEQTTVPIIFWLGGHASSQDRMLSSCVDGAAAGPISHDNLFHTELGLLGVSTTAYKPDLDVFSRCRASTRTPAVS